MASKTITLTDSLHSYMLSVSRPEPDILRRLREETQRMPESECQIASEQGPFMALLVQLLDVKKALEIGVFTGFSSLSVALALPADGKLIACDISDDWTQTARRYWKEAGVADRVELHIGPAIETLARLEAEGQAGTFDFAFIDADKVSYDAYYEATLKLLRPGGLVLFDNTFMGGKVADSSAQDEGTIAMRALNEKLATDARVALSVIPLGDGIALAMKLR